MNLLVDIAYGTSIRAFAIRETDFQSVCFEAVLGVENIGDFPLI